MELPALLAALVLPFSVQQEPVPEGTSRERYRELVGALRAELSEAGFAFEDAELSVAVLDRDAAVADLASQVDRVMDAGTLEILAALNGVLRQPASSDPDELRTLVLQAVLSDTLAYYEPTRDELVFLEGAGSFGDDSAVGRFARFETPAQREAVLEPLVLHELVHAWRDASVKLEDWLVREAETLDAVRLRQCLLEGEAEAISRAVLLARGGLDLSELPESEDAPVTLARVTTALPYTFGLRFVARLWKNAGWDGLEAAWEALPASTEQVLHASKWRSDAPQDVTLPAWPNALGEVELVHADVIGELALVSMLADLGVDLLDARLAGAGWDGDRIALYRGEEGDALLWRSVWDRPEDAEQFAGHLGRLWSGRSKVRGTIVDWAVAWNKRARNRLLDHMEEDGFEASIDEADAASTATIEAQLDTRRPRLEDGWWIVPPSGVRVPAPEGWAPMEQNGLPLLTAPAVDGFTDNLNCLRTPVEIPGAAELPVDEVMEQLEQGMHTQLVELGLEVLETGRVELDGRPTIRVDYQGELMGASLRWRAWMVLDGADYVVLTATAQEERWDERVETFGACGAGLEFLTDTENTVEEL